jgi:hypothetical protein
MRGESYRQRQRRLSTGSSIFGKKEEKQENEITQESHNQEVEDD